MAKITDAEIERLTTEISLIRLIESQGYPLQKAGKDRLCPCPFHQDEAASLVISTQNNQFNCLECGASGNVIDWVMQTQGVSLRHAVELLADNPAKLAAQGVKAVKRSRKQHLECPFIVEQDDQSLLNAVMAYYHGQLKHSPEALAYLKKRGITAEAIDYFKLGYANRTLGYRLPPKNIKAGQAIRTRLQSIGLLRDSGHEHFNGSIVVPIGDEQHDVIQAYGRKVNERLRKGTPLHLYLPGSHRGVFNHGVFSETAHEMKDTPQAVPELILCQSIIDALTFWCYGFRYVTCSYGLEGFTNELEILIKKRSIDRVLIAYRRDTVGNKAATALAERLFAINIECYRVVLPQGMDVNRYCTVAEDTTSVRQALESVLRHAQWMGSEQSQKEKAHQLTHTPKRPSNDGSLALDVDPHMSGESKPIHPLTEKVSLPSPSQTQYLPESALPASPHTEPAPVAIEATISAHEVTINLDQHCYRIRGLHKNSSYEQLKINLRVDNGHAIHLDNIDLYSAKQRDSFIKQAAIELGVHHQLIKADLAKLLLTLEQLQDAHIQAALASNTKAVELNNEEQHAALELLKSPDLLNRILHDFDRCGAVGERSNKLAGYLACISRKLANPLAIIVQSTSAAGKSHLMEAVLRFMPDEDTAHYAAMTGQSLYYMGETDLKHKILAIAEEEGISQAAYALKLLQSDGELTIASTGKDDTSGNLITKDYRVEGPVMLFLTTTAIDIDEELLNRCLVLSVNEGRQQTQAIHAQQRKKRTLAGLQQQQQVQQIKRLHQNAQRLLKPLAVINPYAEQLTFSDNKTRTRRDHEKYLTLIESIALLHQYQREIKTIDVDGKAKPYIEVSLSDITLANQLAHDLLGRTLDELPPQTRKLLVLVNTYVKENSQSQQLTPADIRFTRRELRQATQWSDTALKVHLSRLVDLEYLLVHKDRDTQRYYYELLYNGPIDDKPFLNGLTDSAQLTKVTANEQRVKEPHAIYKVDRSDASQVVVRALSGNGYGTINRKIIKINSHLASPGCRDNTVAYLAKSDGIVS